MPLIQRTALTFAVLVAALLVTGTAQAQSALPGDTFYTWKRASEQVWRAISPDPVATDVILAERRLNEWIAVAKDPSRSAGAKIAYLESLTSLKSRNNNDVETNALILPSLQSQQVTLNTAGLVAPELDSYLIVVAAKLPDDVIIQSTPTTNCANGNTSPADSNGYHATFRRRQRMSRRRQRMSRRRQRMSRRPQRMFRRPQRMSRRPQRMSRRRQRKSRRQQRMSRRLQRKFHRHQRI